MNSTPIGLQKIMMHRHTQRSIRQTHLRGRAACPIRTGLFIRDYLLHRGEGSPADMHRALKTAIQEENDKRIPIKRLRPPTYPSLLKYTHNLRRLGLIQFTGREESPMYTWLPMKKRYFSLTSRGRAQTQPWENPIRTLGYQ
ncbi:hypothetical protein ACFLWX_02340 [Chloroflexota bacterium]